MQKLCNVKGWKHFSKLILTLTIALTIEKAIKTLEASSKCYILLVIIFTGMPKERR